LTRSVRSDALANGVPAQKRTPVAAGVDEQDTYMGNGTECNDGKQVPIRPENATAKPKGKWVMRLAPDDLLAWTSGLSPSAIRVLLAIEGHCRTKSTCWPNNKTLAGIHAPRPSLRLPSPPFSVNIHADSFLH
jgi:hypothetical protein